VAWRFDPDLCLQILPNYQATPWIAPSRVVEMFQVLPVESYRRVIGQKDVYRALRIRNAVISWSYAKGQAGKLAFAQLADAEAASAELEARLAAAAKRLGAAPQPIPFRPKDPGQYLHAAAEQGLRNEVQEALAAGVEPDSFGDARGRTALHRAACGGDPEIVRLLLAHGADPNRTTAEGATPLWELCGCPQSSGLRLVESARHLLASGADPARGVGGDFPLHRAAAGGLAEIVELLLAAGVDPQTTRDNAGQLAIDRARASDHLPTVWLLDARLALAKGAPRQSDGHPLRSTRRKRGAAPLPWPGPNERQGD
jgi:hypothetical protein